MTENKIHTFTELPYEAVGGRQKAKQKVREQLLRWEDRRRKVLHPHLGMKAKNWPEFMVQAAVAECDKNIEFYEDLEASI